MNSFTPSYKYELCVQSTLNPEDNNLHSFALTALAGFALKFSMLQKNLAVVCLENGGPNRSLWHMAS